MPNTSLLFTSLILISLLGCDRHRKNECEWYLMPSPKQSHLVEPGWVSLCARNVITRKQLCYLKAPFEFSKKIYGKAFRMSKLQLDEDVFPASVKKVPICTPKPHNLPKKK